MRMIVPPQRERRGILRALEEFFETHHEPAFRQAVAAICRFYRLKRPRIEWFEYIDWGRLAGKTYEDGKIHLVHPENWKNGRKYNSRKQWIDAVFHEFGHYVFWADAERKADLFARQMMRGLTRPARGSNGLTKMNKRSNGARTSAKSRADHGRRK